MSTGRNGTSSDLMATVMRSLNELTEHALERAVEMHSRPLPAHVDRAEAVTRRFQRAVELLQCLQHARAHLIEARALLMAVEGEGVTVTGKYDGLET